MSERDAEPAGPALSWAQELVEAAPDPIIVIDQGRILADGPKHEVVQALQQGKIGRAQA